MIRLGTALYLIKLDEMQGSQTEYLYWCDHAQEVKKNVVKAMPIVGVYKLLCASVFDLGIVTISGFLCSFHCPLFLPGPSQLNVFLIPLGLWTYIWHACHATKVIQSLQPYVRIYHLVHQLSGISYRLLSICMFLHYFLSFDGWESNSA